MQALSDEAQRQGKTHQVLLMIDMGDLREGIWFAHYEQILSTVKLIEELPGLALYGLGTNFNCYGTVLPTVKTGRIFSPLPRVLKPIPTRKLSISRLGTAPVITY